MTLIRSICSALVLSAALAGPTFAVSGPASAGVVVTADELGYGGCSWHWVTRYDSYGKPYRVRVCS